MVFGSQAAAPHSSKGRAHRWHGTCCTLPPARGVCEHADTGIQCRSRRWEHFRSAAARRRAASEQQGWRPAILGTGGAKRIECRAPVTGGMKVSTKAGPARLLSFERVDDLPQSRLADCDDDREVVSSAVFAWPPRSDLDDPCRPAALRPACCASLADAQMPRAAYHRSWHAVCLVLPIERRANHHEQYRNDVP